MESRIPLQERFPQIKRSYEDLDRFIPNRSAMDFNYAHYMLTGGSKDKENPAMVCTPYQKLLAEALNMNQSRILAFKSKPATVVDPFEKEFFSPSTAPVKPCRYIPQSPDCTLNVPEIQDNFCTNLLDWSSTNVVTLALGNTVYLWNASNGSASELVTIDDEDGPVTSVSWAPDGQLIAIGLNNSHVQIWDSTVVRQLRTLRVHRTRVGALAWNGYRLTTGGGDGKIINNDVRVRERMAESYRGHQLDVCGLKWSASGQQLASGGNDNLLFIWDRSMASSGSATHWLHRLDDHTSAVKALAWSPFQGNLLASGGGEADHCIKLWNTHTGACLKSVDTGSQVCDLLWSKHKFELLSSHGHTQNQLTLWKYPSMEKRAELMGHTSRVLFMAQSPDGYTVLSAAGDEKLLFWKVFGTPEVGNKPVQKSKPPAQKASPVCGQLQNGSFLQQDAEECWTQLLYILSQCLRSSNSDNPDTVKALFGVDIISLIARIHCQESGEAISEKESIYALKGHISQEVNHLHEGLKHDLKTELEKASSS